MVRLAVNPLLKLSLCPMCLLLRAQKGGERLPGSAWKSRGLLCVGKGLFWGVRTKRAFITGMVSQSCNQVS